MSEAAEFDDTCFQTTDGDIAVINLESARRRSWSRFYQDPMREGIAETVVEHEQLSAQFAGDLTALDRLEFLAKQLSQTDAASARTALIQAQVASMMHRFAEARRHLEQAEIRGAQEADVSRLRLSIDQACGTDLDRVLRERRQTVRKIRWDRGPGGVGRATGGFARIRRCRPHLQASAPELPRCFAVPGRLGVLSARRAVGRIGTGAPSDLRRANGTKKRWSDCRATRRRAYIWRKSICLAVERTTRSPCSCRRFRAAIRKCTGGSPTSWPSKAKMPTLRCKPPDPDSNLFLSGTRSHSPTTVRNSTPEAAMIVAAPLSLRSSTLPIARHCGPSSRHTKWRLPPVTPTPQPRFSAKLPSVGAILPDSNRRHWQHAASQPRKEQPHDNRPPGFRRGYDAGCFRASRWVFAGSTFNACSERKPTSFSRSKDGVTQTTAPTRCGSGWVARGEPLGVNFEGVMIANHIQLILIVTGAFTAIAFGQFVAPAKLLRLIYGETQADAASVMLARHWGLLVGCVGLLLIYAAFEPAVRVHFMIFAVIEKVAFGALILGSNLRRQSPAAAIAVGDLLISLIYVAYLVELGASRLYADLL